MYISTQVRQIETLCHTCLSRSVPSAKRTDFEKHLRDIIKKDTPSRALLWKVLELTEGEGGSFSGNVIHDWSTQFIEEYYWSAARQNEDMKSTRASRQFKVRTGLAHLSAATRSSGSLSFARRRANWRFRDSMRFWLIAFTSGLRHLHRGRSKPKIGVQ
jgi:hypothetical protein